MYYKLKHNSKDSVLDEISKFLSKFNVTKTYNNYIKEDVTNINVEFESGIIKCVVEKIDCIYNLNIIVESDKYDRVIENESQVHLDAIKFASEKLFNNIKTKKSLFEIDSKTASKFTSEYLNEMFDFNKIDTLVHEITDKSLILNYTDFRNYMIASKLIKHELKQFYISKRMSDYQIELAIDNLLKLQYSYYTNAFLGHPGIQYCCK